MSLKNYLSKLAKPERAAFAARCGTTYPHLRNVSYGKKCNESLALAVERESQGVVPVADLHPLFAALLVECGYRRDSHARNLDLA